MKIIYSIDKNFILKKIEKNNKENIRLFFDKNYEEIKDRIKNNQLFEFNEVFIIFNCIFLEKLHKEDIDFINEIKNENVILVLESKKLDIKNLSKIQGVYFENIPELNLYTMKIYINDTLKSYNLNINNIDSLYSLLIPNSSIIDNEIKKIYLYGLTTIDKNLILNIVHDYSKNNIFDLIKFFLDKDYLNLIKCLDNLLFKGYSIEYMILIISGQLFNLKMYMLEFEKNNDINSISKSFNIEEYKIKFFYYIILNSKSSNIDKILLKLMNVELKIKSQRSDAYLEFKKFFLEV